MMANNLTLQVHVVSFDNSLYITTMRNEEGSHIQMYRDA